MEALMKKKMYYNVICEQHEITGGLVIHIDENYGDLNAVHRVMEENVEKYPNGFWIVVPMMV